MKTSKSYDKRTGITYVYEVLENYWDPELKQPRNKRRLIGRWDPETEQIVPTRKRKKPAAKNPDEVGNPEEKSPSSAVDYEALYQKACDELHAAQEETKQLRQQVEQLTRCLQDVASAVASTLDGANKS